MKGPRSLVRPPTSLQVSAGNKLAKTTQHFMLLFYPSTQAYSLYFDLKKTKQKKTPTKQQQQKTTVSFVWFQLHHDFTSGEVFPGNTAGNISTFD